MTKISRMVLIGALAVAGCTNPNRFDVNTTTTPGSAVDPAANYSPEANPTSPVYFQKVVGDRVLFVVDRSELTPAGRATLDGQASWLLQNTSYLAIIEGHADEQGTREYNLALGARRANAVREYLVSRGVAQSRLKTVSYGKERPIEVCSEESCYAKNRRAVTIISAGSLS